MAFAYCTQCVQHSKKASSLNLKKHSSAIFHTRQAHLEKLTPSIKSDFRLPFCSTRWTEIAIAAKQSQEVC